MTERQENLREAWGIPGRRGTIKIKAVNCGKPNCTKCPHAFYAYFREQLFWKKQEKYLGKCDKDGYPFYKTKDFLEKERSSIRKSKDK